MKDQPREPGVGYVRRFAALGVLVAVFFVIYALIGLTRHWQFRSSAYDLGIYDQLVWHLSRFEPPTSSVRGMRNLFADHVNAVWILLTPTYWIAPAVETLITAQAFLFAISIIPIHAFADQLHGRRMAVTFSIAYGLFWGLQRAAEFDVHEYAFAPLVIGLSILALARQAWPLLWASQFGMILIKEDLIPLVVFEGMLLVAMGERKRGIAVTATGLLAFVFIVGWLMPRIGQADRFEYTHLYDAVLSRPWSGRQVEDGVSMGGTIRASAPRVPVRVLVDSLRVDTVSFRKPIALGNCVSLLGPNRSDCRDERRRRAGAGRAARCASSTTPHPRCVCKCVHCSVGDSSRQSTLMGLVQSEVVFPDLDYTHRVRRGSAAARRGVGGRAGRGRATPVTSRRDLRAQL
jgi:predicted membrane protein DUF2079